MHRQPSRRLVGHALVLVALWVVLARSASLGQVLTGVVVASVSLRLVPPSPGPRLRWSRLPPLVGHHAVSILRSTLGVARWTLATATPRPALLAVHLPRAGLAELNWISVLLTLTPGTFVVDVDEDRSRLLVHVLDARDRRRLVDDVRVLDADVRVLFGLPATMPRVVEVTATATDLGRPHP